MEELTLPIIVIEQKYAKRLPRHRIHHLLGRRHVNNDNNDSSSDSDELNKAAERAIRNRFGIDDDLMKDDDPEDTFWNIIAKLRWDNASSKRVRPVDISSCFKENAEKLNTFANEYWKKFHALETVLEKDEFFDRNNFDVDLVVSHVIALGRDQYYTLSNDIEILQFLVQNGECQSLHIHLPDTIKMVNK